MILHLNTKRPPYTSSSRLRVRYHTHCRLAQYNARISTNSKAFLTPGGRLPTPALKNNTSDHTYTSILTCARTRPAPFLWNTNILVGNPRSRHWSTKLMNASWTLNGAWSLGAWTRHRDTVLARRPIICGGRPLEVWNKSFGSSCIENIRHKLTFEKSA